MAREALYFFRLKAADAALMIGIFEVISTMQLYFSWGFIVGMVSANSDQNENNFTVITEGLAVIFSVLLLLPVLLIVGILKHKYCLMVPWLVVGWIKACSCIVIFIPVAFMPNNTTLRVFYTLSAIFSYCVSTYSLFPVCSCFKQMKYQSLVAEADVAGLQRGVNEMWSRTASIAMLVEEDGKSDEQFPKTGQKV
ncbi:Hypothetical predicted protein [Cloeon dipterum]|uniref:DUF7027 domain-containing protein n=2 Tax=Cloeon dipterum TaxID=197152 RepID=A0A8S1CEM8_9INSE|nr:Hypothetical predicted protein [Cloeon dipterum]